MSKVIIIEDDELTLRVLQYTLKLDGHTVETYQDGRSLEGKINAMDIDLFIVDLNLPFISGHELIEKIKSIYGDKAKVLAISSTNAGLEHPIHKQADMFLPKPFNPTDFKEIVRQLLTSSS